METGLGDIAAAALQMLAAGRAALREQVTIDLDATEATARGTAQQQITNARAVTITDQHPSPTGTRRTNHLF